MKEEGTGETGGAPVRERSDATVDDVVGNVQHDFTSASIADALCQLVRPRLAEIVRGAVAERR